MHLRTRLYKEINKMKINYVKQAKELEQAIKSFGYTVNGYDPGFLIVRNEVSYVIPYDVANIIIELHNAYTSAEETINDMRRYRI